MSGGPGTLTAAAPPRPGSGPPTRRRRAAAAVPAPPGPGRLAADPAGARRAGAAAGRGAVIVAGQAGEENRRRGIGIVLDWLEAQPGATWQQRWQASGAGQDGRADWRAFPVRWRAAAEDPGHRLGRPGGHRRAAVTDLRRCDPPRPSAGCSPRPRPKRLAAEMARTRDPAGLTGLAARCDASPVGESTTGSRCTGSPSSWQPRAAWPPTSPSATAWNCSTGRRGLHDPALQEPLLLPVAARRGHPGQPGRADRAGAGGGPPASASTS